MKSKKGFTLIELLAVIVIIAILMSISTVAVGKIKKNQDDENKRNTISGILTGAKEYASDKKSVLSNLPNTIRISTLKSGNYVDFDEKTYPELENKSVQITLCEGKELKLKYSLEGFNDCGCESQPETSIEAEKICEEAK